MQWYALNILWKKNKLWNPNVIFTAFIILFSCIDEQVIGTYVCVTPPALTSAGSGMNIQHGAKMTSALIYMKCDVDICCSHSIQALLPELKIST